MAVDVIRPNSLSRDRTDSQALPCSPQSPARVGHDRADAPELHAQRRFQPNCCSLQDRELPRLARSRPRFSQPSKLLRSALPDSETLANPKEFSRPSVALLAALTIVHIQGLGSRTRSWEP